MNPATQNEELKTVKRFMRKINYAAGTLGIVIHAVLTNMFFDAPDVITNTAHNKAGLYAAIVGIILIAALTETQMWLLDAADAQRKKDGEQ